MLKSILKYGGTLLIGIVIGAAVFNGSAGTADTASSTSSTVPAETTTTTTTSTSTTTTSTTSTSTTSTTTTTAPTPTLTADDFHVELVITENQCFNTAGANITFEPELTYVGSGPYPGGEYLLVYRVEQTGETFNLEVHDDGRYSYDEEFVQTDDCPDELSATITTLRER